MDSKLPPNAFWAAYLGEQFLSSGSPRLTYRGTVLRVLDPILVAARQASPGVRAALTPGGATLRSQSPRLARELPETALHAASRRPTTQSSAAPLTCADVWRHEVLHGVVNPRRIDGKDGVAGSIPAGGSTPNQQARPGTMPSLFQAQRGFSGLRAISVP